MNIELQKTGELTATLKIDLSPVDYEEKVNKVLKDYQRKAQMPGFRPGKVPFSLTKKMYGQAATADEINKLLSDALENYIKDNNLQLLGNPLPNTDKTQEVDWNNQNELSFYFDLGLAPSFEVNLSSEVDVPLYNIEPTDKMASDYLVDIRNRQGETIDVDIVEKNDFVKGDFIELNQDGIEKQEGIKSSGSINTSLLKAEQAVSLFTGLTVGTTVKVNPARITENVNEIATMLGVKTEQAEGLNSDFSFTITGINRMKPAEMNEEFFDKIFPGEEIKTEEQILDRIKIEISKSFATESERKFLNDTIEKLISKANITLPDEFVKRWLVETNQEKLTVEDVERDFSEYARSLRWQLIENKLVIEHGILVSDEEVKDVFRGYFRRPGSVDMDEETKNRIDSIAESFMKNKEDASRIKNQLFETKLIALLKEKIQPIQANLSYEEFIKLASSK